MTESLKAALESLFAEIVAFIKSIFIKEVPGLEDFIA